MRVLPVVHIHDRAGVVEPFDLRNRVRIVAGLTAGEEATAVQHRMIQTQMNEFGNEGEQFLASFVKMPVGPGDLVVLTVDVVVALLGAATSSPPQIIGIPWLNSNVANMLRI